MRPVFCAILVFALLMPAFSRDKFQHPGPIHLNKDGEKWAEKTLRKLSPEEKVGQLFMIWCRAGFLNFRNPEYLKLREAMQKYHVGSFAMTVHVDGPFLLRSEPFEAADLLNRLQKDSKLPLLFAADFERGPSMRLLGTAVFPHAMAFGAAGNVDYAEAFGRTTALESRAIGIHWNFFPDADVNSNPANPIINTRSFGEDPAQVSDLVAAYIRGAHEGGMMVTAKHFPGHGDTATDSHLGLASVSGDRARLDAVELAPFRRAIAAGVDAIMVAHVTVPALDPDPNHVATISSAVVTDLLQTQLGFHGLVVTDALDMAGLTHLFANNIGRAAVESFKAGNDLLLIPADFPASYNAVLQAVRSGEISRDRLDHSVLKILKLKASLGLNDARQSDTSLLAREVAQPENLALGQQIADAAVTLVRDSGKILPLKSSGTLPTGLPYMTAEETRDQTVAVVFSDDVRTDAGRAFARELRARVRDARVFYVDARVAAGLDDEIMTALDHAQTIIAAVYAVPAAGKMGNSVAMSDATGALLQRLLDRGASKTVVIAMGSPYLASNFPALETYLCTFSNATVSEVSAVKALFAEIPIQGHLPVTIPNVAARGAGIQRPAIASNGDSFHAQQ